MDAYEDIRSLGRGAFASVRLVKRKKDGVFFVVKRFHVPMSELTPKERQEIAQEVKLIAHLRHPNVIAFKENFVENGVMHIIMEYATGGTLHKKIQEQEGELFPEETIWEVFAQLVLALRYVHSCNILHRDIKSDNVLTSGHSNRVIKLADFGIAKVLGSQADMAASIIGTPHYLSPELCQGQQYDHKSDIWALGCVLFELCALRKPFDASNMPAIIFGIMRNKPPPLPRELSEELRGMVGWLLQSNPTSRPSAAEIEATPIIQAKLQLWHGNHRRLELRNGLPTPSRRSLLSMGASSNALLGPGFAPTLTGGNLSPRIMSPMASPVTAMTFDMASLSLLDGPASPGSTPLLLSDSGLSPSQVAVEAAKAAAPVLNPAQLRQRALEFEKEILSDIEEVTVQAEHAVGAGGSAMVQTVLTDVQERLNAGPTVSGKVWEALGAAWADAGSFNNAISSYRRSLRSKSANASLVAMEQLGNLLVRRAQQVWSLARTGAIEAALKAGQEALVGSTSNLLLSRLMIRKNRAAELKGPLGASKAPEEEEEDQPPWREAAVALMYEGLAYIERMCAIGSTPERRSLLGSAYKRRAWTGLGPSRTDDLQQAALNYKAAHELETEESRAQPNPYARLNQLTLEMLGGDGSECERLLVGVREAEGWANLLKEDDPADVWLWVQTVDAFCLRYLLGDEGVELESVVAGYRQQFAFGASQRVKSSVMDQLSFLEEVLQGRVGEAEIAIRDGVSAAGHAALFAAEPSGVDELQLPSPTLAATAPTGVPAAAGGEASTAAARRRTMMGRFASISMEPTKGPASSVVGSLAGAAVDLTVLLSVNITDLLAVPETCVFLESLPDIEMPLRVRGCLLVVLRKVRDLRKRLEKASASVSEGGAATVVASPPGATVLPSTPAASSVPSTPSKSSVKPSINTSAPATARPTPLLIRSDSSLSERSPAGQGSPALPPRHPVPMTPGRPGTMALALFSPRGSAAFGHNTTGGSITTTMTAAAGTDSNSASSLGLSGTYNLARRRPSGMPEIGRRFDDDATEDVLMDSDGRPITGLAYHTYIAARATHSAAVAAAPPAPTTPKGSLMTIAEGDSDGAALRRTYGTDSGGETGDSSSLRPVLAAVVYDRRNSADVFLPSPPSAPLLSADGGPLHRRNRRRSSTTQDTAEGAAVAAASPGDAAGPLYAGTTPAIAEARRSSVSTCSTPVKAGTGLQNPFARRSSNSFVVVQGNVNVPPAAAGHQTAAVPGPIEAATSAPAAGTPISRRSSVPTTVVAKVGTGLANPFARSSSNAFLLQHSAPSASMAPEAGALNPFARTPPIDQAAAAGSTGAVSSK